MWDKLKKIFTKPRLILLGKVVVFVVGAVFTYNLQLAFFFGAGGLFGIAILVWYAQTLRDLANRRCVAFLIVSMLIGVAVYIVSIKDALNASAHTPFWLACGVLVGTILLPVAHKLLLGTSWKRILISIPSIYGIWILFFSLSPGFDNWEDKIWINNFEFSIINHVTIWQAAYMVSMFGFRKKELEAMESLE